MGRISKHPKGLGYIVLYGTASAEHLTYDQALACIRKHGLEASFFNPPSPKSAFSRSIKEIERMMPDKFARKLEETARRKVMVVIHEHRLTDTPLFDFRVETHAALDKADKTLVADGPDKEFFLEKFKHYSGNVIGDDLRHMARKIVEAMGGFSLRGSANVRDAGGIYFVPKKHARQLEALSNVLEELNIGYLKAFGVMRGSVEQESLFSTAVAHLQKERLGIADTLTKLKSNVTSARRHKRRLERLKELLLEYAKLSEMSEVAEPLIPEFDNTIELADIKIAELSAKQNLRNPPVSAP